MTAGPNRYEGLPEHWSDSTKELHALYLENNPEPSAVDAETIFQICDLLAEAEANAAQVGADGRMVKGKDGVMVKHPLIPEIRLAKSTALAALAKLSAAEESASANPSAAGRAMARQRWNVRKQG